MKKLLILICLLGQAVSAPGQDVPGLYAGLSGAVVYLQHSIFLSPSDSSNTRLWRSFEKVVKRTVLDSEWPLMSGSGFFIDSDGTIVTNRHVAHIGGLEVIRFAAARSFAESIDRDLGSTFSSSERGVLKKDFAAMMNNGRYSFTAMVGNLSLGSVSILAEAAEGEPDLALVKVNGGPFPGIRLADTSMIGQGLVGSEVLSLGYPLGSELKDALKDQAVTMNRGTISAFRRTELSLQHSAAISHGNSGGPLVSMDGVVVGVNTASLQEREGNSLYYAIDAGQVVDFLTKEGFQRTILWNRRLPSVARAGSGFRPNALGEIETSADVIVDTGKDVEVFLDGIRIGAGAQVLHLVNPVSALELRGQSGTFSAHLRMLATLSGATTLKPELGPATIPVTFTSNPSGASVIADGRSLGMTPLNVALTADTYAVHLQQSGDWYADSSVSIRAGQDNAFVFDGQKAYPVTFKRSPEGAGVTFRFEGAPGTVTFPANEEMDLPTADWSLRVGGSEVFSGVTVPVTVGDGPVLVDLAQYERKAGLRIIGLDPKASVWIDGIPSLGLSTDTLQIPLGIHAVDIWENGVQPLEGMKITVYDDGRSYLTWARLRGHDSMSAWYGWGGVGVGLAGSLLLGLGVYEGDDLVVFAQTSSYSGYVKQKNDANSEATAGVCALIGAVWMEVIALQERDKYEAQRKYMLSLGAQP